MIKYKYGKQECSGLFFLFFCTKFISLALSVMNMNAMNCEISAK